MSVWMTASIGKAPSLIWHRSMLDLRGLISLDNKTKRVNVLIVADGAGILGKCVKWVLTSGPHSSPPCCDLLFPSLRCSLHPSQSYPPILPHTALHSSCDPVPRLSLSPPIQPYRYIQRWDEMKDKGTSSSVAHTSTPKGRSGTEVDLNPNICFVWFTYLSLFKRYFQ